MNESRITPYVATLFSRVEDALRTVLGLKPDVEIRHHATRREHARLVDFRVLLPNGVELELRVGAPDAFPHPWKKSEHLWLTYRRLPGAPDPLEDPVAGPCLDAIGRLFRAHQRLHGDEHARELWARYDEIAEYAELSDAFYVRIVDTVAGRFANFRLGFRCNQDCGFCWQGRSWPEPPAEQFVAWLDELGAAGVKQLAITGGEPTMHRALPELLRRARERWNMRTMLQTNAVLLRKPPVLARIVEAGVSRLFVSLHAADAELSDRMTRAPGTHAATVAGIEAALGAGLRVGLNCVVERANHATLADHARMIVDRFVRPFPDNPVESVNYSRPQTYHDRDLWRRSVVPIDELEAPLLAAVSILRTAEVVIDVTAGTCGLPACVLRSVPELIYLPEPDAVGQADPAFAEQRRDGTACGRCALRARCQGPGDGYREIYGDRGLVPFEEMPSIAAAFPLSLEDASE